MGHAVDHPDLASLRLAATPKLARRAAWGVLLFVLAAVPVLGYAPWTQTAHGTGRAIAFNPVQRPQVVVSPIQGRVLKWHVVEGQKVKRHDRLVDLVDNDPSRLERLREQLLLADQRRTLARSMVDEQDSRLKNVRQEAPARVERAKALALAADAQVPLVRQELIRERSNLLREEQNYARLKKLHDTKGVDIKTGDLVATTELEEAQRRRDTAREMIPLVEARIKVAEAQRAAAANDLTATEKQVEALVDQEELALKSRESDRAAVDQQYQALQTEVERQENQRVYAPADGTVFRVLANAESGGQLVNPGQQLALLVPDIKTPEQLAAERDWEAGTLAGGLGLVALAPTLTPPDHPGIVAELLIDGNDLPLVRPGDRTLLQFEGWAAVQFAAYPEAAAGTFEGRVYLVDPTSDGQGRFRILVEPAPGAAWPDEAFLRQGVRAQGWVLVGEVTLGYEVWRLLNGFPPARDVTTKPEGGRLGPVGK